MQHAKKQQGFTVIEMLIVLTILAVLTVGFFTSSNSIMRSYQFSSDKLYSLRESRRALEATFNEIRLASSPSIEIKDSNKSITYTAYDENGSSSTRKIYFNNSDFYLYQNISGPGAISTTKKLFNQPLYNFSVSKDISGNITLQVQYTKDTTMSVKVKPLNP